NGLIAQQVPAILATTIAVMPFIESGKVRALATAGEKRSTILPDLPTLAESGFPQINVTSWFGMAAPAGTPAVIVDRLNRELPPEQSFAPIAAINCRIGIGPNAPSGIVGHFDIVGDGGCHEYRSPGSGRNDCSLGRRLRRHTRNRAGREGEHRHPGRGAGRRS